MCPDFSAGEQALGYLYQVRVALMLGLEAPEEQEIVVEGLDDITFENEGTPKVLLQLKHHVRPASLSNSSSDLWKTIRAWSTYLADGRIQLPQTVLTMLTTSVAAPGSVAAMLRPGPARDSRAALEAMRQVARSSTNHALTSAFEAFSNLRSSDQELLVNAIQIVDQFPDISNVQDRIMDRIRVAVSREHRPALHERLEGWWFTKVVRMLHDRDLRPIVSGEIVDKVYSIAEQFRPDSLPIDFFEVSPPVAPDPDGDTRQFVIQLRAIAAGRRRIEKAIIDYYRAFEQRSRWAREELLPSDELERYETKLVDEWERFCAALHDQNELDESDDPVLRTFGKRVLTWMEQEADFRIRDNVREEYVMRGSYHILADQQPARVWWHPLFHERIIAALSTTASSAE